MLTLFLSAFLVLPLPLNGLTATVNDPLSHGTLGDSLLSLDEAVRLASGQLTLAQLSTAESAQVTGSGSVVTCIVVDGAITPSIQMENPLSDLADQGQPVVLTGTAGASGKPVLRGGTVARVVTVRSALVTVSGLRIEGGQIGVDVRTVTGSLTGDKAMLTDLELDGQTQCGLHGHAGGNRETTAISIRGCVLTNMPCGYDLDDQSTLGGLVCISELNTMDGVTVGMLIDGSGMSGFSVTQHWRSTTTNADSLVRLTRNSASTQRQMVMVVFGEHRVRQDLCDIQGNSNSETIFHFHGAILEAGAGRDCLRFHPATATFDIHGSENEITGDVDVACGRFTQRIWMQNNLFTGGRLTIDNSGSLPELKWNRYEGFPVDVLSTTRQQTRFEQCEFDGSPINNASLVPVQLNNSYRNQSPMTGTVQENTPIPAPWFGKSSTFPVEPRIGGTLSMTVDLPFGMLGLWAVAPSLPRPDLFREPFRLYGDTNNMVVLPAFALFRTRLDMPIPNNASLVGLEFLIQPMAVPYLGQGYTPAAHVMRGELVRPRL